MTYLRNIYEDTQRLRVRSGYEPYSLPCGFFTMEIPDELRYVGTHPNFAEFTVELRFKSLCQTLIFFSFRQAGFTVTYLDVDNGDEQHAFPYAYNDSLLASAMDDASPIRHVSRILILQYPEVVASLLGCPDDVETVRMLLREQPTQVRSMMGWV